MCPSPSELPTSAPSWRVLPAIPALVNLQRWPGRHRAGPTQQVLALRAGPERRAALTVGHHLGAVARASREQLTQTKLRRRQVMGHGGFPRGGAAAFRMGRGPSAQAPCRSAGRPRFPWSESSLVTSPVTGVSSVGTRPTANTLQVPKPPTPTPTPDGTLERCPTVGKPAQAKTRDMYPLRVQRRPLIAEGCPAAGS